MRNKEIPAGVVAVSLLAGCADAPINQYNQNCNTRPVYNELNVEQSGKPPYVMVLPGSGTQPESMRAFSDLDERFGKDNVHVYNSAISPSGPGRKRFERMGAEITERIQDGQEVFVVTHSSGAAELKVVLDQIKHKAPDFWDKPYNIGKFNVTLASPTGAFKDIRGGFEFTGGIWKMLREEQAFPFSADDTELRGLVSLNTFPPDIDPVLLAKGLREALPDLSRHRRDRSDFTYTSKRDYNQKLPEEVRVSMRDIDMQLEQAILEKNGEEIKNLIVQRGEITRTEQGKIYGGSDAYFDDPYSGTYGWTLPDFWDTLKTAGNIFSNKAVSEVARLASKGAKLQVIVPEYDATISVEGVEAHFCPADIKQLPLGTHVAPFALQPGIAAQAVKNQS